LFSARKPASLHIPQGSRNGGTIKLHLSAAYSSCNISDPFLEPVKEMGYISLNPKCGRAHITYTMVMKGRS